MTDRTDPRVEALATWARENAYLYCSGASFDVVKMDAARILAEIDRLAWRDVATEPPPDDWIGIVSDDGKWWRELTPPPAQNGEA